MHVSLPPRLLQLSPSTSLSHRVISSSPCLALPSYQVLGADVAWESLMYVGDEEALYSFERYLGQVLTLASTSFVEVPEWSRLLAAIQVLTVCPPHL